MSATRRRLLGAGLGLLALLLTAALALGWALGSASGSAWLLRRLPGVQLESPAGSLLGDFSARRLSWQEGGARLQIEGLRWQGLRLRWSGTASLWAQLTLDTLHADRLLLDWQSDASASVAPASLRLPLALQVRALQIDELQLPRWAETLQGLRARLELSSEGGAQHRLELLALRRDRLQLAGSARLASDGPLQLQAELVATQAQPTLPWQARLQWRGPLAAGQLSATLAAAGQTLQAEAELRPFAPWPLASLSARAHALDLAPLHSGLPRTALSGTAELEAHAWDQPAALRLQLVNALAGRWDQQRLPVQSLRLDLQLRPDRAQALQLRELQARLGGAREAAGEISATGRIAAGRAWSIDAKLERLRSSALDERLADLELGGSLTLQGQGLPGSVDAQPVQLQAALQGQSRGLGAALSLALRASADTQRLQLQEARLASGGGSLRAEGELARASGGGWQGRLQLQARALDPRLLWRGAAGSAWQRGPHSLNASLDARLAQGKTWPLGETRLTLEPSLLGGVPLSGTASYRRAADAAPQAQLRLDAAGGVLSARFDADTALQQLQAEFDAQAPQLARLTPWLRLWREDLQLQGSLQGHGRARWQRDAAGRWSAASEGQATLGDLVVQAARAPALQLKSAALRWQLDLGSTATAWHAPLLLQLEALQLRQGQRSLQQASLDLQGSWAAHRLQLSLQGQPGLPAWAQPNGGGQAELLLALRGGLDAPPLQAEGFAWAAHLERLQLRPTGQGARDWLSARGLDLTLQFGGSGDLQALRLAPGQLQLAGLPLSWQQAHWQAARTQAENAALQLDLQLAPLAVAPLLARWQPDFGWGGDLVVGGRAQLRSAPTLALDLELLRAGGDLTVTDERGVQPLGLSDLRLALSAHDGLWQLTQAFAGTGLGSLAGAVSARTAPEAWWPGAQTPIEGVLQANVARLGSWGGWVPAGWRLAGHLSAGARLSGTLAAPELTGLAEGAELALRNALLGVDVRDAAFALRLQGSSATLERFTAQAGGGSLSAQGQARLGLEPQAQLQIEARRFALLSRVDRRLLVSGRAALALREDALQLDGRLAVDEGLFDFSRSDAPTLDEDVQVLRSDGNASANGRAAPSAAARKARVALLLDLGQDLKLRGRGIDTRLRGELNLTHRDGRAALNGVVSTEGGSYAAYGQKLEIERGEFTFVGPLDNPRLDVLAVRPNTDTRVGVTLTGTALNPRIKLFSEPEMSETDKLSWLLLGRGPDGLGRADTALLQRAALALLSGEGESASGRLIRNLGLDELSLRQADQEAGDARGTIVRLGKQLSRRWFVGYERGLNATTGSWQLIYRIAQRFTLRAQSGDDNAVDLIWSWRWD